MNQNKTPCQSKVDSNLANATDRDRVEFLFKLLDDIDTAGDVAKSDDKVYREIVERKQKRRWETGITSDGYTLTHPLVRGVDNNWTNRGGTIRPPK